MMLKDDEKIDWVSIHGPGKVTEQIEYFEKKILETTSVQKERIEPKKPSLWNKIKKLFGNIINHN